MFIAISLLLVGFVAALDVYGITSATIRNNTLNVSSNQAGLTDEENDSDDGDNSEDETTLETEDESGFCGTSTLGVCVIHSDCVKAGCSNSVCQSKSEEPSVTTCEFRECYDAEEFDAKCGCIKGKCQWVELGEISRERLKEAIKERNRIKATTRAWECPTECTCTGSTIKCTLASGREMTIIAGNSGNVIVQVKGESMTTNVTLYKSGGKLYGVFRGNETKIVRMLPDQVKERIRERIQARLDNENITLNEDGSYDYTGQKRARLFFIFPVRMMVRAEIDAETGEVIKVSKPKWWGFLAKDEEEAILGVSCGTVTPGQNDACCQNKGFDVWNVEKNQCDFSE